MDWETYFGGWRLDCSCHACGRELTDALRVADEAHRYAAQQRAYRRAVQEEVRRLSVAATGQWFRTYSPATPSQTAAAATVAAYRGSPWCLLLSGPPGVGKTHLLTALWKRRTRRVGIEPFLTEVEMEQRWRAALASHWGGRDGGEDADEIVSDWCNDPRWLFLDDLGVVQGTKEAWVATIGQVIHTREKLGLPTVMSTNLSAGQIESRYGARFLSRVQAGWCVRVDGPDNRVAVAA